MTKMTASVFLITIVFVLTGCCGRESMFVLLPDPDGKVGAISVSTPEGSVVVDRASEATVVSSRTGKPSQPAKISQEKIQAEFGEAMAILPEQPVHFILYFLHQSTELTESSKEVVPDIVAMITKKKSQNISVVGHADRAGDVEYNLKISQERATTIARMLEENGVLSSYLKTTSHGEGNPLITTADGVQEPRNRRVEVVVK